MGKNFEKHSMIAHVTKFKQYQVDNICPKRYYKWYNSCGGMDFVKTYEYGECECCSHKIVNVCSTKSVEKMAKLIDMF
jgi:hypothetical protein